MLFFFFFFYHIHTLHSHLFENQYFSCSPDPGKSRVQSENRVATCMTALTLSNMKFVFIWFYGDIWQAHSSTMQYMCRNVFSAQHLHESLINSQFLNLSIEQWWGWHISKERMRRRRRRRRERETCGHGWAWCEVMWRHTARRCHDWQEERRGAATACVTGSKVLSSYRPWFRSPPMWCGPCKRYTTSSARSSHSEFQSVQPPAFSSPRRCRTSCTSHGLSFQVDRCR